MMQHTRELECVRVHGHAYVRKYLRDRVHAVAVFMLRPVCLFLGPDIHTPNPNQYVGSRGLRYTVLQLRTALLEMVSSRL